MTTLLRTAFVANFMQRLILLLLASLYCAGAAASRLPVKLRVSGACHLKGYAEFNAVALVP